MSYSLPLEDFLDSIISSNKLTHLVNHGTVDSKTPIFHNIHGIWDVLAMKTEAEKYKGRSLKIEPFDLLLSKALLVVANSDQLERYLLYTCVMDNIDISNLSFYRKSLNIIQEVMEFTNRLVEPQRDLTEEEYVMVVTTEMLHTQDRDTIINTVGESVYLDYERKKNLYARMYKNRIGDIMDTIQKQLSAL